VPVVLRGLPDREEPVGLFTQPTMPTLLEEEPFSGTLVHTARWDRSLDLTDKNGAVFGTASTAAQLVPEVVKVAKKVYRTRLWLRSESNISVIEHGSDKTAEFRAIASAFRRMFDRSEVYTLDYKSDKKCKVHRVTPVTANGDRT
jgi:cation diffusion facilitator CzcD-associated flavoprotein CzcO